MANKGKMVIYQVLPRLYGNLAKKTKFDGSIKDNGCGKFADFTDERLKQIVDLGATHIWYTGVLEHATQTEYNGIPKDHPAVVKGKAGSPYAVKDYYDVDPDLAVDVDNRMAEYEDLLSRSHKAGLKVVMDFIPNHVARHYVSDAKPRGVKDLGADDITDVRFFRDNNFYYLPNENFAGQGELSEIKNSDGELYKEFPCKVTGDDYYANNPGKYQWYETVKLNYGKDYTRGNYLDINPVPNTWEKMLQILLFWAKKKVDAFRCDMAEMVPLEFWEWAIKQVKAKYPKILFIAETYNPAQYGDFIHRGGFDYLYDKVGLYDTLRSIAECRESASAISNNWKSLNGLAPHMLTFMENHDEQRLPSPHVLNSAVKARPCMFVAATVSTAPTMLYFGQEFGEPALEAKGFSGDDGRTTIFDYSFVPSIQRKLNGKLTKDELKLEKFYSSLLNAVREHEVFSQGVFYDLMYVNYNNPNFDHHRAYAYLRKSDKELCVFVANFKDETTEFSVNIPPHAFEFLGVAEKEFDAIELISGKKSKVALSSSNPLKVKVEGQCGAMLCIKL
ncbi:MAG: alpha-amylase family glycosyl hydrolase [Paludibacteraceae bacterium]|nr:alpha-amylase family glycosyl hydrolase [Paludibacteraceae bacterium]